MWSPLVSPKVEPVTLTKAMAVVSSSMKMLSLASAASTVSRNVLPETIKLSVPAELSMRRLSLRPPRMSLLMMEAMPTRPCAGLAPVPSNTTLPSKNGPPGLVPLAPLIIVESSTKPVTLMPRMP
jgi:hypothetical protein